MLKNVKDTITSALFNKHIHKLVNDFIIFRIINSKAFIYFILYFHLALRVVHYLCSCRVGVTTDFAFVVMQLELVVLKLRKRYLCEGKWFWSNLHWRKRSFPHTYILKCKLCRYSLVHIWIFNEYQRYFRISYSYRKSF